MDLLYDLIGTIAEAARRVWAGVLGAAIGGYLGWQALGFLGFLIGAGLGALGATFAAARLGLIRFKSWTGSERGDLLAASAGGFAVVIVGYMLMQFVLILAVVAAVIAIGAAWLLG